MCIPANAERHVSFLQAEKDLYSPLLLYGEGMNEEAMSSDGDAQLLIGRMLPFLQHLSVCSSSLRRAAPFQSTHMQTCCSSRNTLAYLFVKTNQHSCMYINDLTSVLLIVQVFCNRINVVVKNLVQQLGSIYSPRPPAQAIDINNVHLDVVFQALGDALAILATLDELIAANPVLLDHWTL